MPDEVNIPAAYKVNVDLNQLVILLDAARSCGESDCEMCKHIFNSGDQCPLWINKENSFNALQAIEKYLDDEYDKTEKVRGDKLVKILLGEAV